MRRWLADNDDVFRLDKRGNKWTITMVDQGDGGGDAHAAANFPSFVGVQDWVYFRADESTASLVERCKIALDTVLHAHVRISKRNRGGDNRSQRELDCEHHSDPCNSSTHVRCCNYVCAVACAE